MAAGHNAAQPICSMPQKILDGIARAVSGRGSKQLYPYPHIDEQARFTAAAEDLICMALTCKAFLLSAQKELYRYPVLTDDWGWAKPYRRMERRVELAETLECDFQPTHSIYLFVRPLLARPDLAKLVEHFRLELIEYHLYHYGVEPQEPWTTDAPIRFSPEEEEDCLKFIDGCFPANESRQLMWKYDLEQYWCGPWAGVALALLRNVESITLATDVPGKHNRVHGASSFKALFGGYLQLYHPPDTAEKSPYIEMGVLPSEIPQQWLEEISQDEFEMWVLAEVELRLRRGSDGKPVNWHFFLEAVKRLDDTCIQFTVS